MQHEDGAPPADVPIALLPEPAPAENRREAFREKLHPPPVTGSGYSPEELYVSEFAKILRECGLRVEDRGLTVQALLQLQDHITQLIVVVGSSAAVIAAYNVCTSC